MPDSSDPPTPASPETALAIAYARPDARAALRALFLLDERLAAIRATARDPAVGLLRLAWWRDALAGLDHGEAPAEPLLRALAAAALPVGAGAALAGVADGWWALLEADVPDAPEAFIEAAALDEHARCRGAGLFGLAARILGEPGWAELDRAGELWALADLARRDAPAARKAWAAARRRLGKGADKRWPVALRPLGMLAALAAADARAAVPGRLGSPARLLRMAAHRLTGRAGLGAPPASE